MKLVLMWKFHSWWCPPGKSNNWRNLLAWPRFQSPAQCDIVVAFYFLDFVRLSYFHGREGVEIWSKPGNGRAFFVEQRDFEHQSTSTIPSFGRELSVTLWLQFNFYDFVRLSCFHGREGVEIWSKPGFEKALFVEQRNFEHQTTSTAVPSSHWLSVTLWLHFIFLILSGWAIFTAGRAWKHGRSRVMETIISN